MNKLYIYGVIGEGDLTAQGVQDKLTSMGNVKEIDVHINSGGGSVIEGNAIHTILKNHKAKVNVYIDSLAASIASVIACAGDSVTIASNGLYMIHNAMIAMQGNQKELEDMASTLNKITSTIRQAYMSRDVKITEDELVSMMDKESWLTASEALELGFVDNVTKAKEVSASITKKQLKAFNNAPELLAEEDEQEEQVEEKEEDTTEAMFAEIIKKLDTIIDNTKQEEEPEVEEDSQEENSEATNNSWLF